MEKLNQQDNRQGRGRWKLFLVIAVCASPVLASYFAYYVVKPTGRTNYGTLLDPRQYPMPALASTTLEGKPETLDAYKGKWVILEADGSACADQCKEKLFYLRQLRLMQGKDMDRIERAWLVTDDQPVDTASLAQYNGVDILKGAHVLRASKQSVQSWLPADAGASFEDYFYLIDPVGNLMMRFPRHGDPAKIKKDLTKLLQASSIG